MSVVVAHVYSLSVLRMQTQLERPQFCHHITLRADHLSWHLVFFVGSKEQMLFQFHCDGGILLNLPLRFTFEQLKMGGVSGGGGATLIMKAYRSVGVVQEILQGIVRLSKRLLENFG